MRANENLKKRWVPLLVRTGPDAPEGNQRLTESGAIPIDETSCDDTHLIDFMSDAIALFEQTSTAAADGDVQGALSL